MTAAAAPASTTASGRSIRSLQRLLGLLNWVGPLVILAAVWEGVSRSGLISERLLPPFSAVVTEAVALLADGEIFLHLGTSLYRALVGLALGASTGVLLGIGMALMPLARRTLYPFVTLTYTLPKSALIPIAFLWLGVGNASTILVVFLATVVPLVINAYHGAEAVPEQYLWSARSMGAGKGRLLTSVIVPAAMPHIMNGLRIALAFSVVVVISAEMVAAFVGIGKFIFLFGEIGSYTHMFAAIGIVVLAAFILDRGFAAVSSRLLRWSDSEAAHG